MKAQKRKTTSGMIIQAMKTMIGDEGFNLQEGFLEFAFLAYGQHDSYLCIINRTYLRHLLYLKLHTIGYHRFVHTRISCITVTGSHPIGLTLIADELN